MRVWLQAEPPSCWSPRTGTAWVGLIDARLGATGHLSTPTGTSGLAQACSFHGVGMRTRGHVGASPRKWHSVASD